MTDIIQSIPPIEDCQEALEDGYIGLQSVDSDINWIWVKFYQVKVMFYFPIFLIILPQNQPFFTKILTIFHE